MALGSLPTAPETWGRWPQPQTPAAADFTMMEPAMVPYDCRTGAPASVPRPEMAQHFLPGPFSQAPMPAPVSPEYHAPVSYAGYNPYCPPPMLDAPFKPQECLDRCQPRVMPIQAIVDRESQEPPHGLPFVKRSRSPSVKSEPTSNAQGSSPSPKAGSPNGQTPAGPLHQFNTAIDNIVRVIQAKPEILSSADGSAATRVELGPVEEKKEEEEEDDERKEATQRARGKPKRKRFACDIPGCNKMFAQKNNLDTHRRSHTGESPYSCPYCVRRFTQGVNLNSHINRHTGARPYKCPECPKTFPQPSNVKAHLKTHVRRELRAHWICRFGNCQKAFTAKGNLKNHQNTYHVEEIEAFNAKLASVVDKSMLSDKEKDMARYLAEVHNLANKGIKGRGKGRKVKRVLLLPPQQQQQPQHHHQPQQPLPSPATSPLSATHHTVHAAPYPMSLLPQGLPAHPQQHHAHHQPPPMLHHAHHQPGAGPSPSFYGLSNPAAYSMSRGPMPFTNSGGAPPHPPHLSLNTRDAYGHGAYGMLDSDQLSDASSVHGSTPVMHVYEDEQGRELAFGERLY